MFLYNSIHICEAFALLSTHRLSPGLHPSSRQTHFQTHALLFGSMITEFNQGSVGSRPTHSLLLFYLLCGCKSSIKSSQWLDEAGSARWGRVKLRISTRGDFQESWVMTVKLCWPLRDICQYWSIMIPCESSEGRWKCVYYCDIKMLSLVDAPKVNLGDADEPQSCIAQTTRNDLQLPALNELSGIAVLLLIIPHQLNNGRLMWLWWTITPQIPSHV